VLHACHRSALVYLYTFRDLRSDRSQGSCILVEEELAFAVCFESALAIRYWWGTSVQTVAWWRRALGVERMDSAESQHVRTNTHYREYWGGVANMPEIAVAEMVCDWYARSQEFGTGLREWITTQAIERFQIVS
jgi:hypothetical protein